MGDEVLRDGRYRIVGKLGEGAQGTTFDAVDGKTGVSVAIKRFSVRGAKSWKDVELAEREAKVLETLSHPALPAHVEHFEENGALYLVMEKIEGQSLAALTSRGGALSRDDVVRFLRDAASVLEYLHGRAPPVIHRDINPKNVIRRPDGSFALVDFGAVRDRLKPEGGSTVVGTFGYMAPEQLQGRALPSTDVYSVGATALRLLTGREPETLPHRGLAVDVAQSLGRAGDPALREILGRMLDPDPDRRAGKLAPLLKRLDPPGRSEREARQSGSHRTAPEPRESRERRESESRRSRSSHDDDSWGPNPGARGRPGWDGDWGWDDGPEHWARDARRWARAERERAREVARRSRDEARRTARLAWQDARRARRGGRPVNGPPLLFAIMGLTVAILVVGLVLGVAVPAVLMILSLVFGRPLREAARATRLAGERARKSMSQARTYLLHGPAAETREEPEHYTEVPPERTRLRVEPDAGVVDTTGTESGDAPEEERRVVR
jgi:hypothetical protein